MPPWKLNISDIEEAHSEQIFRGTSYERYRKQISVKLGNYKDKPHPYDVELTRLPPGVAACPIHKHEYWWELFIIISGEGEVHRNGEMFRATAGDCLMQPPGTRHRIRNTSSTEDLIYYVIANEVDVRDSGTPLEV